MDDLLPLLIWEKHTRGIEFKLLLGAYVSEIDRTQSSRGWNGHRTKPPYTFLPGARLNLILARHDAGFCFVLQRHARNLHNFKYNSKWESTKLYCNCLVNLYSDYPNIEQAFQDKHISNKKLKKRNRN